MHFFLAQVSWYKPDEFFNSWGKPLFTTLSSPFAQFGFNGMIAFNLLLFAASVVIGWKILKQWKVSPWIAALFPLILLTATDVIVTNIGGHTEPLFNFCLILAAYLFVRKRFIWFAVVVSLMPLARSEGELVIILSLITLVVQKQFKAIPFLASGILLFSIFAWFHFGEFDYYFTHGAYQADNDIYGNGQWYDYLKNYHFWLGEGGLLIGVSGLVMAAILLFKKQLGTEQFSLWFIGLGTFGGVVFIHSYFWATGQYASAGLTRIATQGMPLFILLCLSAIDKAWFLKKRRILIGVTTIAMLICIRHVVRNNYFPVRAFGLNVAILESKSFLDNQSQKIHAFHPLVAFIMESNPKANIPSNPVKQYEPYPPFNEQLGDIIHEGEFIVRDSHFGPREACMPRSVVDSNENIVLVAEYISPEQVDTLQVYQYVKKEHQVAPSFKDHRLKIDSLQAFNGQEFIMLMDTTIKEAQHLDFAVETSRKGVHFVVDIDEGTIYDGTELIENRTTYKSIKVKANKHVKIYFWNPDRKEGIGKVLKANAKWNGLRPVYRP